MEKVSFAGETLLRWRVGHSTFLALPEKGARLMNWNIVLGDGSVRDVLYWPENANMADIAQVRGGNPILFPFNARTFDHGDIHFWRAADGVRRPMPMHGLARQGAFKVTQADTTGFTALYLPNEEARAAYPFDYEFIVRYRFEPLGLICELSLRNLGTEPLPWSAGHHFYFTLPWTEGLSRSDYAIRLPASQHYKQDVTGALVPGPILKEIESLANPDLIDTIHLGLRDNTVVFGERGHAGDVVVSLGAQNVPPANAAIVTWSQSADAPFYCVEPWMGPPNSPEHKRGLQFVAPGLVQTFTVAVRVK
ncbi:MAG: aldose epimerase [Cephaloticoccus sp.]|nr:aldose epimerase [Cephaloticoccus sp.]MCF7758958.1 aldose epimerase [Cephaloticoccus sp.]